MNKTYPLFLIILIACFYSCSKIYKGETFLPLKEEVAPHTVDELWADFDPRKEPLDTEILHEWEEDGVIMQVLRYRVGIFK